MENSLVTIIIPVYKVERYIRRCVDSVLSQSYQNLQIILVDDGSPDNCGKICDSYMKKDSRVKTIHQLNGGLSIARNTGLEFALGKFIYFLDSDDYIAPDTIETMIHLADEHHADIVMAGHNRVEADGYIHCDSKNWPDLQSTEAIKKAILVNNIPNFAWGKLYRKSLWDNYRFPEHVLMEDMYIVAFVFYKANRIFVTPQPFYYYSNESSGSIMRGRNKGYIRLHYGQFLGWKRHVDLAKDVDPSAISKCVQKAAHAAVRALSLDVGVNMLNEEEVKNAKQFLANARNCQFTNAEKAVRWLILSDSFFLPLLGSIQRKILERQIKRRVQKIEQKAYSKRKCSGEKTL